MAPNGDGWPGNHSGTSLRKASLDPHLESVAHDNTVRLHSGIGSITPADKLSGREAAIWTEQQRKPATAEVRRRTGHAESAARRQPRPIRRPSVAVDWRGPGRGGGHAETRPRRPPRGQDRAGRHEAAPRPPGIGPKSINLFPDLVLSIYLDEQLCLPHSP
jgi:hypothetical protein